MALFRALFGRVGAAANRAADAPPAPDAAAWRERGNAALAGGDFAQAARCYEQAVAADPQDALARMNLGFVLLEQGEIGAARQHFMTALAARRPDQKIVHEIRYFLGRCYRASGDAAAAIENFKAAVGEVSAFAEPMEELAGLLHEAGDHAQALEWARRLRGARPCADSDLIVAQQLHHLKRHEEALKLLDEIVEREPGHAAAWTGRGNVLVATGRALEAVDAFERALAIVGPNPDALANSGGALSKAGRFDEALQRVELALQRDPTNREALSNRLNILLELVRIDAALDGGRQAVAAYPQDADLHWNLAIACLLAGRFEEGWREHEWRWQATASRARHPLTSQGAQWTGAQDLQGRTILLFSEQGFGDSLQMLRYVPLVAARGARVLLHLPVGLHGLKLTSDLASGVALVPPGEPLPPFDFHCPLMSLPLAFGSNEATIPREVPYLRVDPARVDGWRQRLHAAGRRLKVGIVWSGNAAHGNDANRSIPLAMFRSLGLPGCVFVSLQQQVREPDRATAEEWTELHRWGEELVDFDDTAALIEALDLVISVDTSVAHLAGALGRPLWVLLPHCPDWRWMVERTDSPWYPGTRLFRQPRRGDWQSVLASVLDELHHTVEVRVPPADATLLAAPRPSWPELLERAQAELAGGSPDEALRTLEIADLRAGPHPLALHVRGNALFAMARHEEAALAFDAAFSRKPDLVEAAANAAAAWNSIGRPREALERAEQALRIRPAHVISLSNRVIALQSLGRSSEAVAAARAAHQQLPDDAELRWTYGATALLNGDYANGWKPLDARWELPGAGKRPQVAELGCPVWTGAEPIDGRTLLLLAEQGFGDTLQFVRYVYELRRRGARVVLRAQPALQELLQASLPDCTIVAHMQDAPRADFHACLMDLPLAMGTATPEAIPKGVPYLRTDPQRVAAWRSRLPATEGPRVGLVWSGHPAHANDRNRSLALSSMLRASVPGVRFVSLQREVREADRPALLASSIQDVSNELRSFSDTAALVDALDLVISVDTSVAHLAGALGKPVWVLLPHRPDWRWLLERDDSPWYPTARLFRQPAPRAWEPVLEAVRDALAGFASATSRASA